MNSMAKIVKVEFEISGNTCSVLVVYKSPTTRIRRFNDKSVINNSSCYYNDLVEYVSIKIKGDTSRMHLNI